MFYEQLKKACKMRSMSVTSAIKQIGIGTANGTYWKNGSVPSSDIVVKLSELLGVTTDFLLTGKKAEKKPAPGLTEDEQKILNYYTQLTEEQKDYIKGEMARLDMANKRDTELAAEKAT